MSDLDAVMLCTSLSRGMEALVPYGYAPPIAALRPSLVPPTCLSHQQLGKRFAGASGTHPGVAFGRAGVMQQAIVIQADDQRYDTLEVRH